MAKIPRFSVEPHSFAVEQSPYIDNRVLAATTAESHTVPTDTDSGLKARYVLFSANGDFWCKMGGTAAIPAADVTDGSGSEVNPALRKIPDGITSIGLIAPSACVVTMQFFL